ncbi:methylenetetrahydrofolate dehydrogenase (NADP+)/methenyltetrahydrofolate cyclohydrolase [Rhizobium sp. BK181]|nr:methylenetetrahydrofolate dehydrogenase (NADP+)/methenyltetrahydrofolate cyclohydrolase [Rhizobium sp. BK181]
MDRQIALSATGYNERKQGQETVLTTVIDGKQVAASVIETVKAATSALDKQSGVKTGLAVVIVGDDPASHAYVNSKSKMAKECGFKSVQHTLPVETTQEELAALVASLNDDPSIHGILVQLPLPKHLKSEPIIQSILPEKDVDGLHVVNAGKLATGDLETGLVSCTPAGAMVFVRRTHGEDLSGLNAVVIGRSNLFGKPMAQLLLNANATVTIAHSRTKDLPSVCRNADILVAAVGRPEMVKSDWVKPGATVIDVGINRIPAPEKGEGKTRLVGDVAFDEAAKVAAVITPVPGGVGPMTIAMLMANTVIAAHRTAGQTPPKF